MSLVTTCPSCGTVFRMVREQLDASGGWVRCGHCMEVFDAKAQFAQADLMADESAAAFDLAGGGANTASGHLSFVATAKRQAFWTSMPTQLALIFAALALLVMLLVQMLRTQSPAWLANIAPFASLRQTLCTAWPCSQRAERQIEAWVIENAGFHKENAAFRLTALLKNSSQRALLIPQLELTLIDSQEAVLVRKTFEVASSDRSILKPADEYAVNVLITPPIGSSISARDITGYRLVLFYP